MNRMHPVLMAVLLSAAFVLAGCGQGIPDDKRQYIGSWEGGDVWLRISESGRVNYRKHRDGMKTKISGPIKEWRGDDFVVGFWFFAATFKVERPPYRQGGGWKMVVDGVQLTRM